MKSNLIELKEHFSFKENLAQKIAKNHKKMTEWFKDYECNHPYQLTTSLDVRDSGYKIVPVDCNLYPAGFNNLCAEDLRTAPQIISNSASQYGRNVLILSEENTRNQFYIQSLFQLSDLMREAGFNPVLGWLGPLQENSLMLTAHDSTTRVTYPLKFNLETKDYYVSVAENEQFTPDWLLLNHDLSGGCPEILSVNANQPVIPSAKFGWYQRTKSQHFHIYNKLAAELANLCSIDPWVFTVDTEEVDAVDLNQDLGLERVAEKVGLILKKSKSSHVERNIPYKPFVYVKNNAGTYGMGIQVFHSVEEVTQMNRREKNKLSVGKNKSAIHSLVVQEGVPTNILIDRLVAEPVVYLFRGKLIGGFFRAHEAKSNEENLNSQGVVFRKMCMTDASALETGELTKDSVYETVYGTIGKLSALAAAQEKMK